MLLDKPVYFEFTDESKMTKRTFALPSGKQAMFYKGRPQRNPINDSRDVSYLKTLGIFEVVVEYKKQNGFVVWKPLRLIQEMRKARAAVDTTGKLATQTKITELDREKLIISALKKAKEQNALTAAGKPKIDFISQAVGFDISAKERDAYWEKISG